MAEHRLRILHISDLHLRVHINNSGSTRMQRLYFGAWELYREEHNGRVCLIETRTVAARNS